MIRIDELALELASLAAEGAVTLDANRKATGQVSVSVGSLADFGAPSSARPCPGRSTPRCRCHRMMVGR